jgi:hypothetical protein
VPPPASLLRHRPGSTRARQEKPGKSLRFRLRRPSVARPGIRPIAASMRISPGGGSLPTHLQHRRAAPGVQARRSSGRARGPRSPGANVLGIREITALSNEIAA